MVSSIYQNMRQSVDLAKIGTVVGNSLRSQYNDLKILLIVISYHIRNKNPSTSPLVVTVTEKYKAVVFLRM